MAAGVWQRHPRYSVLVLVAILTTVYLLVPYQPAEIPANFKSIVTGGADLEGRIKQSHEIYDRLLDARKGLIKKFGPNPSDIALFPPDKAPWPPYTVWDFFPAAFNCPHEIERLGALGDGGKWVCGLSRVQDKPDCVVYSFGINYESSFEAEILKNTQNCEIWGYDFSVKSFGPEIPASLVHRTHFKAFGLGGEDKHGPNDDPPMYTIESLMRMNGHTHIDILKIDIEGFEFATLTTLLKPYVNSGAPLPFGQLQLEIHIWEKTFPQYLAWWEMLESAGLRPFWTEPNLVYQNYNKKKGTADLAEYSFLNVKGDNIFITDSRRSGSGDRHPHHPPARD
ncbi:hypothetical protein EST38_g8995 [Candolleomyces aberdarensis]|uniref:Methyltransferase domain-containing protein n=1 Tax=Candolleomyces aberdarensis TaxID=2316362 RepID=A0A4Q2DB25_9AGAR|nr:hypothetical protein EST38_g8995 [Candolleomyces aberdarensis]